MRVTVTLPDDDVKMAMEYTNSATKSEAVKNAVRRFVQHEAGKVVASYFGKLPDFNLDPDPKMLEPTNGK
jgi:hypothetical protein